MIGDTVEIRAVYMELSEQLIDILPDNYLKIGSAKCIAIGGESGCGKSSLAIALKRSLDKIHIKSVILHQDDYFSLPPKTNHVNRVKSLDNVGVHEVKMELLDSHIKAIKEAELERLKKPLVHYHQNEIHSESIDIRNVRAIIVDGTYTMLLKHADLRIFMTRNYKETKDYRISRGRDIISTFNEEVLHKEHNIIKQHLLLSDYVIDKEMVLSRTSTKES